MGWNVWSHCGPPAGIHLAQGHDPGLAHCGGAGLGPCVEVEVSVENAGDHLVGSVGKHVGKHVGPDEPGQVGVTWAGGSQLGPAAVDLLAHGH